MAHVLIADDDEIIAEMAAEVLIDAGHACGWVTSGESAWNLVQRRRPDILLLDHDMPGISGVGLLRRLRSAEAFYDLPVIMFTAMCGKEDEDRAIYAGADEYIRKPFNASVICGRVERVLAERETSHLDLKTRLARDAGLIAETRPLERRWV